MTKMEDNQSPYLTLLESAAPGTPASTLGKLYVKTDGILYFKNDAGTESVLSGGGAGGIPATILDAKGDLIGASAADTAARLAVGANGLVLVAASGETTGLKWGYPAFVGCRAFNNGAQTLSAATETTITMGSEEYDTNTLHDTSSNTGRITIPSGFDGKWRFSWGIYYAGNPGVSYAYLRKNGTTAITGSEFDFSETTNNSVGGTVTIALVATDYIEIRAFRASGGDIGIATGGASSFMEAQFVGT